MTLDELNGTSIDKINALYETLMESYQTYLDSFNFKVGDYIYKYKRDETLPFKNEYPFLIKEIYVKNNNNSVFISLPKITIKTNKCLLDKRPTKAFYTFDDIENYKIYTEKVAVKEPRQTYVYLIEAGELYKIGFSNNPSSRLKGIQTHNPYKCSILYKIKDPFGTLEKDLHSKFHSLRINGEWFKKSDLIINEFELLMNNEHQVSDKSFTLFPISA
jgi:Meiotically up-regulated gene 113